MDKAPYLATDGCGKQVSCLTFGEALATIESDMWHIYEWQDWQYVQVW